MIMESHKNFMGETSFDINNPLTRLACMSASSFFGEPMYYKGQAPEKRNKGTRSKNTLYSGTRSLSESERKLLHTYLNSVDDYRWRSMPPQSAMELAIDEALEYNPEETLRWAVILRNEECIRVTPQIILVRAANFKKLKGSGIVRHFGRHIIKRADEPATQMAYQLSVFKRPIPNSLKRTWADFFLAADEYSLSKYRMEDRVVKTVDVANMAFGRGAYGLEFPIGKLVRGELSLGGDNKTWESIRSSGGSWEEAIGVMGHMALLRNIRNIVENKVDPKLWLDKFVKGAENGKQLPFRYLSAFYANKKDAPGYVLDAIEECLNISIGNLPKFQGRTLSLSDNSGSAHGAAVSELSTMTVAQIGNLMGVLTGMVSDEGVSGVFGDRLECLNIRKNTSIFDQTDALNKMGKSIGTSTENGIWLALDKAIRNREHWDNIFIYSDMQAGHGGLYGKDPNSYHEYKWGKTRNIDVPKLISTYRNKVYRNVNVFLVQIAGYEDTLLPEYYHRTFILGGWSGNILKFAHRMVQIFDATDRNKAF